MSDDDWMSDAALYPDRKAVALVPKSQVDALTARVKELEAMLRTASDMNEVYEGRLQELEAALEWYADSAHYRTRVDPYGDGRNYPAMVQLDYGEKARAALTPTPMEKT